RARGALTGVALRVALLSVAGRHRAAGRRLGLPAVLRVRWLRRALVVVALLSLGFALHRLGLRRLRLAHALRVGGHRAFLRGRLLRPGLPLAHAAHRAGVWLPARFRGALGVLAIRPRLPGFAAPVLARLGA